MGYKFVIEYKKGSTNRAADALSLRADVDEPPEVGADSEESQGHALLTAATHPVPQLLDLLRRETASSPQMREITKDIREGRAPPHLTCVDG